MPVVERQVSNMESAQLSSSEPPQNRLYDVYLRLKNWITQGGRKGSTFVHTLMTYSNWVGISPYCLDKECLLLSWMKKIPAGAVAGLGAICVLMRSKDIIERLVGEKDSSDVGQYMEICHDVGKVSMICSVLISFWIKQERLQKAAFVLESTNLGRENITRGKQILNTTILLWGLGIATVKTFHLFLNDPMYEFQYHAQSVREALFLSPQNYTNNTPATVAALGCFGTSIVFAGNVIEQLAFDSVLLACIALSGSCARFKFKKRSPALLPSSIGVPTDTGNQIMTDYNELKKISKAINKSIELIFGCVLLSSLFTFAVYADIYFEKNISKTIRILWLTDLIKPLIFFYFALNSSNSIERFQTWIGEGANRFQLGLSDAEFIVEYLGPPPIGLGEGPLYVNFGFLMGYFGLIGAYFFGIVETRQPNLGSTS